MEENKIIAKDIFGNEVKIGDNLAIAVSTSTSSATLSIGVVKAMIATPKRVKLMVDITKNRCFYSEMTIMCDGYNNCRLLIISNH